VIDSKTLSSVTRASLLDTLCDNVENLGWSVRVLRSATLLFSPGTVCDNNSPRDISSGMLRRPPINLNKQSQEATISLIRGVLQQGIKLIEARSDI
jgi:ribonuclease H2 subunit A